nr:Toll-like receptor protein [Mimachlamys nobilis]
MSLQAFVTFALFLLTVNALFPKNSASQESCFPCHCHKVTANCSNQNTTQVPVLWSNVTKLILSHNNFPKVTRQIFVNVKTLNITSIKLDYCKVIYIFNDAFLDFQRLKHLNMSGNRRLSLKQLYLALVNVNVTHLNLDDMGIRVVPVVVTVPFRRVTKLSLRGNMIENFTAYYFFKGFPSVKNLNLAKNKFTVFPFRDNLKNIEVLNLAENSIESPNLHFCGNRSVPQNNLLELDLSWNFLSDITVFSSEGHCLAMLQTLILNNNYRIFKIPDNVFSRLPRIKKILLKYVSGRLDIEPLGFNVSTLQELRLSTSEQLTLQPKHVQIFKLCPKLRTLHFTNVVFKDVQDNLTDMFSHLVDMKDFKIKSGIIWDISFLETMKKLSSLDLFGNHIKGWDPYIFNDKSLKKIVLSANLIAVFNHSSFPQNIWDSLKYFSATSNPFACTCNLTWFKNWLANNSNKLSKNYPKLYTCLSPDEWKDKTVTQYEPENNECQPALSSLVVIGIGLGCLAGVLLLLGLIVYKGRYHIKHRMLLVRSLQPYDRLPEGQEFVYDAFVAHHVDNRLWVINHLLPFLEKQRELRLCLHERDFLPGSFIADNIVNNMKVSRKVILVFSRDFVNSEWCLFEATNAYNRIVAEGASSVVIIMLEDISQLPVHTTIRNLLRAVTYIEWGNGKNNRPEFFRKLLDALK